MKRSLPVILLVVSLTACVSKPVVIEEPKEVVDGAATLLLLTLPEIPAPPSFPMGLNWGYSDGLYTLDEEGVDRLLNFRDNEYTSYVYDVETWQMQLDVVKEKIKSLNL